MNRPQDQLSRRRFLWITSAAYAALAVDSLAVEESTDDLTELVKSLANKYELPALAGGAMRKGKLVGLGAWGVRRLGHPETVTNDDKFHIGSCTKAMTASVAAMLVEAQKLRWDSTLAEVFPERREKFDAAFRTTTIEALLMHRAGLPHDGSFSGIPDEPVALQRLAYMDALLAKPPAFEAGSFHYSNAGYIIVGTVIERLTGKPWETVIREKLFNPLGMKTAGFGCCSSSRNATDGTWGHVMSGDKLVPRYGDNHRGLGPAGTVHCSVADYLKFASWHSSLGARPAGLLQKSSFTKLHHSPKGDYAMGWMAARRTWAKGFACTHAGSNTMNYFIVWIAPEIDFALAVACNASRKGIERDLDQLAAELVKRYSA